MVRETSIISYIDLIKSGKINEMQTRVLSSFLKDPDNTDKEISVKHDIDINVVTARRNELVDENFMFSSGKRKCSITGRLAHTWAVRPVEDVLKGKLKEINSLKDSDMEKIHKKILRANQFQKDLIISWCKK